MKKTYLALLGVLAACASPPPAGGEVPFGVNLSGGEFHGKKMPGKLWKDYSYPSRAMIDLAFANGARLIRLPLREGRIQDGINGPLRPEATKLVQPLIAYAIAKGMIVVVDWHSYGKRDGQVLGTGTWDAAALANLNIQFLAPFKGNRSLWIGLQNEPIAVPAEVWWRTARESVRALRTAGFSNRVVVSGARWSGAHDWMKFNAGYAAAFADPANDVAFDVHQYYDWNSSGTDPLCIPGSEGRLDAAIADARAHRYKLFLGETGVSDNPICTFVRRGALAKIAAAGDVFVGVAWWTMSDWIRYPRYAFGLSGPGKTTASPLLEALRPAGVTAP